MITKKCELCDKEFNATYKSNRKYCSQKCYWITLKGNTINLGRNRLDMIGNDFAKGHEPWNKGTKGICKPNSTSFKKGNFKEKHPNWKGGCSWYYTSVARDTLEHKYGIEWNNFNLPNDAVIHHINGNRQNNIFENLCIMTRSDHCRLHLGGIK